MFILERKKISVVVPCFNEEESLPVFYSEIVKITEQMEYVDFEFILVDDGSTDGTLEVIKKIKNKDLRVRFICFSRNFGKEAALYAGIEMSSGDLVAIMDADMQDPPYLLPEMFEVIQNEDYDIVATRRSNRKGEPLIRSLCAKVFYKFINRISKTEIVDGARDFRLMTRQVVDAVLMMGEYNRFSKGMFSWIGFNTKWISYENTERVAGSTKWSFFKLLIYSIEGIVAFSEVPLAIASVMGIIFFLLSILMIIAIIIKTLIWKDPVSGWPSLACIMFFVSGIQLFCTGILGEYLAKTYLEVKKRPIYITKEKSE